MLLEVLRIGNILPLSMGQRALVDGTLWDEKRKRQYFIPRGTDIIWNLGAVLKNPEYFPNPEEFDPTRSMPYYTKECSNYSDLFFMRRSRQVIEL